MNALIQQVTEAFTNRKRTDLESYWESLGNKDTHPDVLMTLCDKLGKNLADLRQDAGLLEELGKTPKPDPKARERVRELSVQAQKSAQKAADLIQKGKAEQAKSEGLRHQASALRNRSQHETKAHDAVIQSLALRGHPEYVSIIEDREQARAEHKAQVLTQRRESDLIAELKRLDEALADERSKPEKRQHAAVLNDLQSRRQRADRALQALREHG